MAQALSSNPAGNYLRAKVMTATPEQLQMMLYDGAITFCEQARTALQEKNYEQTYNLISRIQKIIVELSCSLKREVSPDLCGKLSSLYNYAYRKLIEASTRQDAAALEDALMLLRYQRETWAMLMNQLGQKKAAAVANQLDLPAPNERMEASISVHG